MHFESRLNSKFQHRMMILYLASKSAISATAQLPSSICFMLHRMFFCWKIRKLLVYLIKICNFNQSLLVIDAKYWFFRTLTTTFQHPYLFLITAAQSIVHAQFGTFMDVLYYISYTACFYIYFLFNYLLNEKKKLRTKH